MFAYCSIYFLLVHEIEHYDCLESWFVYCSTCILTFSPLKPKNSLKKEKRNVSEVKYEFVITLNSDGLAIVIWFKIGNKT